MMWMSTLVDLPQNLMKFWKGCDRINYVYLRPIQANVADD